MNGPLNSPAVVPVPETDLPVRPNVPEFDQLREVREEVAADSRINPEEYLDEVRVPLGGE